MSQQESLTEMFKKMSDMIEGLVAENDKLKEKNAELNEIESVYYDIRERVGIDYEDSDALLMKCIDTREEQVECAIDKMEKVDKKNAELEKKNAELEKKNAELEKKWEEHTDSIVETYFANTGCADITHKELEKLKEKNVELEKKNAEMSSESVSMVNKLSIYSKVIDANWSVIKYWIEGEGSEDFYLDKEMNICAVDEDDL
tara:strand:- start:583 stop:1188 length:606 start_codon:yes stop_codon:yes gene_type:complete